jgi:glycosyltransferase involved in cell wall biosynthesis
LDAGYGSTAPKRPFLTVAIPHYNHTRYLEVVISTLRDQTFDDFEVVVSDDCSSDNSNSVIPDLLRQSGLEFRYYLQQSNLGYDANLRFCLNAARGRYVLLLGNDDALASSETLKRVTHSLAEVGYPTVAITNYEDFASGRQVKHIAESRLLGRGPATSIRHFRAFSFVSGIIFDREAAAQHETDRWDRSVFYQIYLACRIIAAGGTFAMLAESAVRKDVRIGGRTVPNYESNWASVPRSYQVRCTGLASVVNVTADAVLPFVPSRTRSTVIRKIAAQVLAISYPFWLFEYRRVSRWSFAVGIARGMRPRLLLGDYKLKLFDRVYLGAIYLFVTATGLIFPSRIFNSMRGVIANSVRRRFSRPMTARA